MKFISNQFLWLLLFLLLVPVHGSTAPSEGGVVSDTENSSMRHPTSVFERIRWEVSRLNRLALVDSSRKDEIENRVLQFPKETGLQAKLLKQWADIQAKKSGETKDEATPAEDTQPGAITVRKLNEILENGPTKLELDEDQLNELWAFLHFENRSLRWGDDADLQRTSRDLVREDLENLVSELGEDVAVPLKKPLKKKLTNLYNKRMNDKYSGDSEDQKPPEKSLADPFSAGELRSLLSDAGLDSAMDSLKGEDAFSDKDALDLAGQVRDQSVELRGERAAADFDLDSARDSAFLDALKQASANGTRLPYKSQSPKLANRLPRVSPSGAHLPSQLPSDPTSPGANTQRRNGAGFAPEKSADSGFNDGLHGDRSSKATPPSLLDRSGLDAEGGFTQGEQAAGTARNFFKTYNGPELSDRIGSFRDQTGGTGQALEKQQQQGFSIPVNVSTRQGQHLCQITLVKDNKDDKDVQVGILQGNGKCSYRAVTAKHCVANKMTMNIPGMGQVGPFDVFDAPSSLSGNLSEGEIEGLSQSPQNQKRNVVVNRSGGDLSMMRFETGCVDTKAAGLKFVPLAQGQVGSDETIIADGSALLVGKSTDKGEDGMREINLRFKENGGVGIYPGNSGGGVVNTQGELVGAISSKYISDSPSQNERLLGLGKMASDTTWLNNVSQIFKRLPGAEPRSPEDVVPRNPIRHAGL